MRLLGTVSQHDWYKDRGKTKDRRIDGKSILPILQAVATTSLYEPLYYSRGTNLRAVREGC